MKQRTCSELKDMAFRVVPINLLFEENEQIELTE